MNLFEEKFVENTTKTLVQITFASTNLQKRMNPAFALE